MFDLPGWLLIIPILGFLIFVHELGHFVTAKKFGITVTEFGFGFPPRLIGIPYRGTIYSINLIPVGGFVKMVGEEDPTDPGSFAAQSVWKRAIVLLAGSFMNLVVPIVIFTTMFMLPHNVLVGSVVISGVSPNSPAQHIGLKSGDTILSINGHRIDNTTSLLQLVTKNLGNPIDLTIRRGAVVTGLQRSPDLMIVETLTVTPRINPPRQKVVTIVTDPLGEISLTDAQKYYREIEIGETINQGFIGIFITTSNARSVSESLPMWEAFPMSLTRIFDILVITKNGIQHWIFGGADPGMAGPIGIAQATGEVAEFGLSPIFEMIALLSISLSIINVLPIPALDGGRLLFILIECLRNGRRISPQREGFVHFVGFVILIGLILCMSYFDILRILNGESILR